METTGTTSEHAPRTTGERLTAAADAGIAGVVHHETGVRVLAGAARYGVAALVSVVVYPVLAAVLYIVLLVVATGTDQGLGGPLGLPMLVLLGAVVGVVLTAVAVAVSALAEVVGRRARAPRLAVAAVSVAVVGLLAAAVGGFQTATYDDAAASILRAAVTGALVAMPAAVIVTGVAQSGGVLTNLALRAARRRAERRATSTRPA